jgi:type VI secretion system protein ImpA
MSDLASTVSSLIDWDAILAPIPGDSPSGKYLRNEPAYDALRDSLKPPDTAPGGVWQREQAVIDYRNIIRDASNLLIKRTKDLDVAVWLVEALAHQYGFGALSMGLELAGKLMDTFWDTVWPAIDEDGDEGFRARPINRFNSIFLVPLQQVVVTRDAKLSDQYTVSQYGGSRDLPSAEKASNSSDLTAKREKAKADGTPMPEEMDKAIAATPREFFAQLASDVTATRRAVDELQEICNRRFRTDDRPYLEKLSSQLEGLQNTVDALLRSKPATAPAPAPPPVQMSAPAGAAAAAAYALAPEPETVAPVAAPLTPEGIPMLAAAMRQSDASDPVPYLLLRSWRFGPMLARGTPVDEGQLEAPPTEIRTALRRAALASDWYEVLNQTEAGMEHPSGACYLDLQYHSHRAATELGYTGLASAIRGMLCGYLQALPDLPRLTMLDGSATASADTTAWIRDEVMVNPAAARKESLDEVRDIDFEQAREVFEGAPPDPFEVAESELASGRFSEAFRVLSEAAVKETTGRARTQRKVQLAKICVEGGQYRIALPMLREICRGIEEQHLENWEPPDFVAAPLAMLYQCLAKLDENHEERQRVYDRLCALHPMKALELSGES